MPTFADPLVTCLLGRYSRRWEIVHHPVLNYWSAEKVSGTAIRYLAGSDPADLATKIERAETAGS